MTKEKIQQLFDSFDDTHALVIGDVMIDAYYWGRVDRVSPEAPVPVVSVTNREYRMGGAANVALNLQSLGAKVSLCSVLGADENGEVFRSLMDDQGLESNGLIVDSNRPTTVKTRILSQSQQMLRVDEERTDLLSEQVENELFDKIDAYLTQHSVDVVIFEDYDKGVCTPSLIRKVIDRCILLGIPVTVDPKRKQFFDYSGCTLFKPNLKELREGLGVNHIEPKRNKLEEMVNRLRDKMPFDGALITLSEHGVFYSQSNDSEIIPAHQRAISDVSGAGDTVIATASLCLAQKASLRIVAQVANLAGGLVCESLGVVPIDRDALLKEALEIAQDV